MTFIRGFYIITIDCLTATSLAVPRVETVDFMILGSALQPDFALQQAELNNLEATHSP